MPDLYVTPKGQWTGTQADAAKATRAEGSPPGSWKTVPVPTKKGPLLDFLNNGWKPPAAEPEKPRALKPVVSKDGQRFRVFVKRQFAAVVHADSREEAEQVAIANMEVRPAKQPVQPSR